MRIRTQPTLVTFTSFPSITSLSPFQKKITIHPGVVVNGPHPDGKYDVAMISKNLPHNPPQQKITDFHPQSTAYGNVHLGPPKRVELQHMKPWKDGETGDKQAPMSPPNLANLKKAMGQYSCVIFKFDCRKLSQISAPHAGWRPPSPVPERPKTPPPRAGGSRIPIAKTYHVDKPVNHPGGPSVASGSNSASWRKPAPKRQTTTNVGQKPAAERKPPVKQAGSHKRSLRSR